MIFTDQELKDMAVMAIKEYLNNPRFTKSYIEENYGLAIKLLAENSKNILSRGDYAVSSMTKGAKSITFESKAKAFTINEDIKMLLPRPYIGLY